MQGVEFTIGADLKEIAAEVKKQEESLPPDLRADELMNHDKVMFWSGQGADEDTLPLTGE